MNDSFLALPSMGPSRAIPGVVCRNFTGALEVLYRPPAKSYVRYRPPETSTRAPRPHNNKQSVRADVFHRFPHLASTQPARYAVAPS